MAAAGRSNTREGRRLSARPARVHLPDATRVGRCRAHNRRRNRATCRSRVAAADTNTASEAKKPGPSQRKVATKPSCPQSSGSGLLASSGQLKRVLRDLLHDQSLTVWRARTRCHAPTEAGPLRTTTRREWETNMTNLANDALNRSRHIRFATGTVRSVDLTGERPEHAETKAASATSLAVAAAAIGIFCLGVTFGPAIYFNGVAAPTPAQHQEVSIGPSLSVAATRHLGDRSTAWDSSDGPRRARPE